MRVFVDLVIDKVTGNETYDCRLKNAVRNLAKVYQRQRKFDEAERLYTEAHHMACAIGGYFWHPLANAVVAAELNVFWRVAMSKRR